MGTQRFHHLHADGEHRVEGHHRVLKDHRDTVAADVADLAFFEVQQVFSVELDGAVADPARFGDEVQDGEGQHGFTGAGFAHNTKAFALFQRQGDAAQGLDLVMFAAWEGDVQIFDFEHGHQSSPRRSFGLSTSRSQSPSRFSASTSAMSTSAG